MAQGHGRVTGTVGSASHGTGAQLSSRGVGGHRHSQTILATDRGCKSTLPGTREPETPPTDQATSSVWLCDKGEPGRRPPRKAHPAPHDRGEPHAPAQGVGRWGPVFLSLLSRFYVSPRKCIPVTLWNLSPQPGARRVAKQPPSRRDTRGFAPGHPSPAFISLSSNRAPALWGPASPPSGSKAPPSRG